MLYTICFCPNSSLLLGSLLVTSVCPVRLETLTRFGCERKISCSVLTADEGRLLSHSGIDQMEGPDLGGPVSY